MTIELDAIDRKIIRELVRDARISQVVLSERAGLSPTACARRLQHLEKAGIIRGYAAEINAPALGYRIGDAAYTPDLHDIPEESWPALEGLDLWIVDGLRYAQHPSHFSVRDVLQWIDRFKPKRAVITNMHADLDYEVMRKKLPSGIIPAYDGMRLTLGSE